MDGGGNSIFIWKSGQEEMGLPLSFDAEGSEKSLPFFAIGYALIDVTMASKSSPAIPQLLHLWVEVGRESFSSELKLLTLGIKSVFKSHAHLWRFQ